MNKRVFLAINLPEEIKTKIFNFSAKLDNILPKKSATFGKKENLHLTLHFLGGQDEEAVEKVKRACEMTKKAFLPFLLGLGNFDGFPNLHSPKVLFIDIQKGLDRLKKLRNGLGQELEKEGFKIDIKPFNGHITLARVKEKIIDLTDIGKDAPKNIDWQVNGFDLMESKLSPKGPTYSILKSFLF